MTTIPKVSPAANAAREKFRQDFYYAEQPAPFAKYDDAEGWNLAVIHDFILTKLSFGSDALADSWELGFKAALRSGCLKAIPGWELPVSAEEFEMLDTMSAAEYKQRILNDPKFPELSERAERQRAKRGPYDGLTAEQYRSIPPLIAQQKHTYEPAFREAVQRLIDEGAL